MVAVAVLSPEETGIALYGALPEPGYRPFPGSARERALEQERENEEIEFSLNGIYDDDEARTDISPTSVAGFETSRTIPRIGSAQAWKRTAQETALLVVRQGNDYLIVALGTIEGSSRAAFDGVRNLEIRVRYVLGNPVSLASIRDALSPRELSLLDETIAGQFRPLSPALGQKVMSVLRQNEMLEDALAAVQVQTNAEAVARARARQPRPAELVNEAMSSALHFFGAAWHNLRPIANPAPSDFAYDVDALVAANENDVITDETSVFPGWDRQLYSSGGWWEFRNKGRRLLIKNINVSTQESRTGADLVYVRRNPDAFVLVQYKLLEQLSDGRPIFRPDGRLDSQIEKMLVLENLPTGALPDNLENYRVGPGFSFVKFVLPSAVRPERPGELTPGYYFPSEFARRILSKPDVGPSGGVVH